MEQKLYDAAAKLPETSLNFQTIQPTPKSKPNNRTWRAIASLAACFILLISIGFITAEAKEYSDAIKFFNEYRLSTSGLRRGDIKAVYRDITTKSFTYPKTAEVIANSPSADYINGYEILQGNPAKEHSSTIKFFNEYSLSANGLSRGYITTVYRDITTKSITYSKTAEAITNSLSADHIDGYKILQDNPTQKDIENLRNNMNYDGGFVTPNHLGIHYEKRYERKEDMTLDKSFIEKYDGDTLLWSTCVSEFWIYGYSVVSDGVIVYGSSPTWTAWMSKVDSEGNLLWKHILNNGFDYEDIVEILENPDGSYAVISDGDHKYFCLSQYTADGKKTFFKKTDVGSDGIMNAALLGDGYIVQFGQRLHDKDSKIVKVDCEGNIIESFSYDGGDAYYYVTDMIEYNEKIYLSAYSVQKLADEDENAGGRHEIAAVLNYLFDNDIWEISSEALTSLLRDNYTAMLLVCDPTAGTPQEFYSVDGSLGGKLSLGDSGILLWDVESITTSFYSPETSSYSIGGTSYVFRYTFDSIGGLVSQEKTGEVVNFER